MAIPAKFKKRVDKLGELFGRVEDAILEGFPLKAQLLITQVTRDFHSLVKDNLEPPDEVQAVLENVLADVRALIARVHEMHDEVKARGETPLPYKLRDVEGVAHEDPKTFQIPPKEDRLNLSTGELVKLIFTYPTGTGERMWVKVTNVIAPGEYEGELNSDSMVLVQGIPIKFGQEHVADIWTGMPG